jgi:hypothetical protein
MKNGFALVKMVKCWFFKVVRVKDIIYYYERRKSEKIDYTRDTQKAVRGLIETMKVTPFFIRVWVRIQHFFKKMFSQFKVTH